MLRERVLQTAGCPGQALFIKGLFAGYFFDQFAHVLDDWLELPALDTATKELADFGGPAATNEADSDNGDERRAGGQDKERHQDVLLHDSFAAIDESHVMHKDDESQGPILLHERHRTDVHASARQVARQADWLLRCGFCLCSQLTVQLLA